MVIGNGFIGSRFKMYDNLQNIIIYASGVSNSREKDIAAFERERNLLISTVENSRNKLFVYFSTTSIFDPNFNGSPYTNNKLFCEDYIMSNHDMYVILRLPQVVGKSTNPHTLTNYLYNKLVNNDPIEIIDNIQRNCIDIEDVFHFTDKLIKSKHVNKVLNLGNPRNITVNNIVAILKNNLCSNSQVLISNSFEAAPFSIDLSFTKEIIIDYDEYFNETYYENLFLKYYK
jgi:nucleoside-diphosphate-sugar epimerase